MYGLQTGKSHLKTFEILLEQLFHKKILDKIKGNILVKSEIIFSGFFTSKKAMFLATKYLGFLENGIDQGKNNISN